MQWITRCPECATVYQLEAEQLQASRGWLQCGHCQHAFDSTGLVLAWSPGPDLAANAEHRVDIQAFLRHEDAPALRPQNHPPTATVDDPVWSATAEVAREVQVDSSDGLHQAAASARPPRRRLWPARMLVLGLAACLALQMLWFWRDAVGARWPVFLPALQTLCRPLDCRIESLRLADAVLLEGSRLLRRPALADETPGYGLQVSVRNASSMALAMVSLELTLTDAHDKPLLRRVLHPSDMGAPALLKVGQAWEGRVDFGLDLPDAVSGYRLVSFYP